MSDTARRIKHDDKFNRSCHIKILNQINQSCCGFSNAITINVLSLLILLHFVGPKRLVMEGDIWT